MNGEDSCQEAATGTRIPVIPCLGHQDNSTTQGNRTNNTKDQSATCPNPTTKAHGLMICDQKCDPTISGLQWAGNRDSLIDATKVQKAGQSDGPAADQGTWTERGGT
jgi:hypothetical protein